MTQVQRVTYRQTQATIDGSDDPSALIGAERDDILQLHRLAQLRRRYRAAAGCLQFYLPDPMVSVRPNGDISVGLIPPPTDAHKLIEELMVSKRWSVNSTRCCWCKVMAGEAAAKFALKNNVAVPFRAQQA